MANMLSNIRNPIDDPDFGELFESCQALGLIEEDADEDEFEYWELRQILKEYREEMSIDY
jgi:hypothetical protein